MNRFENQPVAGRLWKLGTLASKSPSIRNATLFAFSGAAFALGNLLLARALAPDAYAQVALLVAILVVASSVAPLGLDQVLLRKPIHLSGRFLGALVAIAASAGIIAGGVGFGGYGLSKGVAFALGFGTMIVAINRAVTAALRRHQLGLTATFVESCTDLMLLIAGMSAIALGANSAASVSTVFVAGVAIAVVAALARLNRVEKHLSREAVRIDTLETASLFGIAVAGAVLVQAERLTIPLLLPLHSLAIFGVLTSVGIAPFRVLGSGIIASFVQEIRKAGGPTERRNALKRELRILSVLLPLSVLVVVFVGPWVAYLIAGDAYPIPIMLALAACVNGTAKVLQSLPRAIVVGAGTSRDLNHANAGVWMSVVGTIGGAAIGSKFGLAGLTLGAGLGNLAGAIPTSLVARRLLIDQGAFITP